MSYKLDDWLNFKVGDVVFECEMGIQMAVKVLTKPTRNNDGQVTFKAHIYDEAGRRDQDYLGTFGFEQYAPRLHEEPQYIGVFPFGKGSDKMKTLDIHDYIMQVDFEMGDDV